MMTSEKLLTFVRELSADAAIKMEEEKITPDLVHLMTDEELSRYLPVHGDRLRVRQNVKENPNKKRKNKLLSALHKKLEKARKSKGTKDSSSEEESVDDMRKQYGNKNAKKDRRFIEIGWTHKAHERHKQVRSKTGGGTRKVRMPKETTRAEIIEQAKTLFFPNGKSPKGDLSDFELDLWDFSDRRVLDNVTVKEMYEETKMPILRFYLATWQKTDEENTQVEVPSGNANTETNVVDDTPAQFVSASSADLLSVAIDISGIASEEHVDDFDLPDLDLSAGSSAGFDEPVNLLTDEDIRYPKNVTVRIHRGHVLTDMIQTFKAVDLWKDIITFEMVMPNGTVEVAEDGGGVTRDSLTEFWNEFYEQCTLGTDRKVPCLRHDFGEEEWTAVAKIIYFGWHNQKYFPVQLSLPFIQQCVLGHYTSDLIDSFFNVVPVQEREVLKTALSDFSNVDEEDLLDILDGHDVRRQPTESNIVRLVNEIAHKELIQAPMFVADCWVTILRNLGLTEQQLLSLYSDLEPASRRVCKAFAFPESMTLTETTVSNHLKRFVRGLSAENLKKFVRFCTGSDLLITNKISVAFVNVTGLGRRPVAHTCSNTLELSRNYDDFLQFRNEFMCVLESNVWVMDIV